MRRAYVALTLVAGVLTSACGLLIGADWDPEAIPIDGDGGDLAREAAAERDATELVDAALADRGAPPGDEAGAPDATTVGSFTIPGDSPNMSDYVIAEGTVRDKLTGLVWQQGLSPATSRDAAKSACASLTLEGRTWRVPFRFEIVTIVDYASPPFPKSAFLDNAFEGLWTASTSPKGDESYTLSSSGSIISSQTTDADHVKCVSGAPLPDGQYARQGGTATSTVTGLVWQQGVSPTTLSNTEAQVYCSSLDLGGFASGWRLPTVKELHSLVVETSGPPAIDTSVFTGKSSYFWSSTRDARSSPSTPEYWLVHFFAGNSIPTVSHRGYARCVR